MSATTNSVFFSGETEGRAVLAAANHFGVPPDQVVFDRVEKRHGFVKRRRVVIRVDPERVGSVEAPPGTAAGEPARRLAPSASEGVAREVEVEVPIESSPPQEEGEASGGPGSRAPAGSPPQEERPLAGANSPDASSGELPDRDSEEVPEVARAALRQLLELADVEVSAEMVLVNGRLEVEIEGVDQELLVEDEGQVLLALQHLLPRVMYGELGRIVPCHLDSGGYQRRKEERLRGLARRVGDEVASRGGTRTLRPMNPADRRIVHLTLADDPDVETESQGRGYFKRVNIRRV